MYVCGRLLAWSFGVGSAILCSACTDTRPRVEASDARCRHAVHVVAEDDPGNMPLRRTSLRWSIVSDSVGRPLLDAYCAGVGPAIVIGAPHRTTSADTVIIINWNVALGAGDVRRLVADLRAGVHTGTPVHHFILLLQEVARTGALVPAAESLPAATAVSTLDAVAGPDFVALARELGLHGVYVPSMRNGRLPGPTADHGNAILSTLPLRNPHAIELPPGIRRRVAISAAVGWPLPGSGEQQLRVVSAHFDNWSARRALASFGAIRAHQARALAALMPAEGPLLLGGDLNTWARGPNEAAYRVLHRHLPRPPRPQPQPTANRLGVPRRLDYLMLRAPQHWHFAEHRIDDRYGSDHYPLLGVLISKGGH